jgi:hypothetical protein
MESLLLDVRYAWRALRKSPKFAALAGLTRAIGISTSKAIFSVINSILLRPLQFAESNQLVHLYTYDATRDGEGRLSWISSTSALEHFLLRRLASIPCFALRYE